MPVEEYSDAFFPFGDHLSCIADSCLVTPEGKLDPSLKPHVVTRPITWRPTLGHTWFAATGRYRERIGDDRLQAVVDHVRGWAKTVKIPAEPFQAQPDNPSVPRRPGGGNDAGLMPGEKSDHPIVARKLVKASRAKGVMG